MYLGADAVVVKARTGKHLYVPALMALMTLSRLEQDVQRLAGTMPAGEVESRLATTYPRATVRKALEDAREVEEAARAASELVRAQMDLAGQGEQHGVGVRNLELNVAHSCNLRCPYCFAGDGTFGAPGLMSIRTARAAVDFLVRGSESSDLSVAFLGGEPLLNFKVIDYALNYASRVAERHGKRVSFTITTNGTLLDPAMLDVLDSHQVTILMSMDSRDDELNDSLRPMGGHGRTSACLRRTVPLLLDRRFADGKGVRMTITRANLRFSADAVAFFEHGFGHVHALEVRTARPEAQLLREDLVLLKDEYANVAAYCLEVMLQGKWVTFQPLMSWFQQLHRRIPRIYHCHAGRDSLAVDPQGRLYPCAGLMGSVPPMGDLWSGIRPGSRGPYARNTYAARSRECTRCWARTLCAGGCMYGAVCARGSLQAIDSESCDLTRHKFLLGMEIYAELMTSAPSLIRGRLEGSAGLNDGD